MVLLVFFLQTFDHLTDPQLGLSVLFDAFAIVSV